MFRTVPLSIIRSFSLYTQLASRIRTEHVSNSSTFHHQEFFTVHTAMVYVIQLASRIRKELTFVLILLASCQQTCMTYTIAVYTVKNS